MVATNSSKVSRAPLYLGNPLRGQRAFAYGTITLYGRPFQTLPLTLDFVTLCRTSRSSLWLPRPRLRNACKLTRTRFGLFRCRSPLPPESRLFSLPVGTEMFHCPTFPPLALRVQARVTGHYPSRVSPFGNPRITVWLSTTRGLSQIPTSFFGSWCQGIHRVPL